MSDELNVETRLRRVEDLLEIQRLANDYGRLLDGCDFAAYAELFAEQGELLLGPMARATGRSAIRAAMEKALPGPPGRSLHIIGTPMVELSGDTATSEVMWTAISQSDDGHPVVSMVGRHRDDLVREGGRWVIQRRRGYVDIPAALPPRPTG